MHVITRFIPPLITVKTEHFDKLSHKVNANTVPTHDYPWHLLSWHALIRWSLPFFHPYNHYCLDFICKCAQSSSSVKIHSMERAAISVTQTQHREWWYRCQLVTLLATCYMWRKKNARCSTENAHTGIAPSGADECWDVYPWLCSCCREDAAANCGMHGWIATDVNHRILFDCLE